MAELKNTGNRFFLLLIIVSVGAFMNPAWAQVQSPDEFLGYELGDYFTPHHRVMAYMNHVAEASDRVTAQVYGHTNERRELMLLTITSPDNHAIIDEIRTNNLKLTGLMDGEPTEEVRAIIWLSYNIHGNETSSSEAAMKTVYELASLSNTDVAHWLEDTVVIVDPMLNPDGRDRYVNWFNGIIGRDYNPHVSTREHHEPWPGGRPNHYYFDLNRDWAWQTQLETQQRSPMYQSWMPHVHVDFHEQGYNSPYYFAPAAEPFHKAITDWQREFQTAIGENNIRYFDAEGWHYFTRERFDLFYPSYGDTWPTFNGAIGMTYEQAGHGLAGASILTQEGDTLTLKDRLTHHHITGISTIEVTAEHADRVIREFQNHFDRARTNPAGRFKTYVVKADNDPDHIYALLRFLDSQNITYGRAGRSSSATGYDYRAGTERRVSVAEEDIIISAYQPQSQMVRVLFEPSPELSDSLTYDITAWESHHRFGLDGYALTDRINPGVTLEAESLRRFQVTGRERPYAYALPWTSMDDARFLADITKEGVRSRYSEVPFEVDGRAFPRGTLVITRDNNRHLGPDFDAIVREAARTHSRSIHGASTGFVQRGSDFGSSNVRFIEKPEVAVFLGDGTSSLQAGEVWHFFDQQLHYPASLFHTDHLNRVDLSGFNTIVLPSGSYSGVLNDQALSRLDNWVRSGGRLIAIGNTNMAISSHSSFALSRKHIDREDGGDSLPAYGERERDATTNRVPGAIFRVTLDHTHPLAFGIDGDYFSLKTSAQSFDYLERGWNVGTVQESGPVTGFAGHSASQNLENSLSFGVQQHGSGSVVYMVDNPLFRAFWENGKLLFVNAMFFVNN